MTDTELKLIASAAIIGDGSCPVTGYSTPAASGMPSALETTAVLANSSVYRLPLLHSPFARCLGLGVSTIVVAIHRGRYYERLPSCLAQII